MKEKYSFLFTIFAVLYSLSLVVSNIIAGKLWQAPFGIVLTAAEFLFPVVYIIGDVVPEVYGLKSARRLIYLSFIVNLFAVIFFWICLKLGYPGFWTNQSSFEVVLGFTPRILLASFIAYLVGSNVNAFIMVKMKQLTNGKWLWSRTITSTFFGQIVDSLLFGLIAFYGILSAKDLIILVFSMAGFKILYEIIATPITYLVVGFVRRVENE